MTYCTLDEMMLVGLRGQERTYPCVFGRERGLAVVYLICSVQFLFEAEEGIPNFPVKFSYELHLSEAWKLIKRGQMTEVLQKCRHLEEQKLKLASRMKEMQFKKSHVVNVEVYK